MKIAAAGGALALVWSLGAAQAQPSAPPSAAAANAQQPARAQSAGPAPRSTAWLLGGPATFFDGRTLRPMDARAVRDARLAVKTADSAANSAFQALADSTPRGARMMRSGADVVFSADGRTIAMTPEQQHLYESFRTARNRRDSAILDISLSALAEQEVSAILAARTTFETARARNAAARRSVRRVAASRRQALERAEREAQQAYQDLIERLSAKVRLRAMAEIAPLRIVHDPALAGREGVIEGPAQRTVFRTPESRILFAQDLKFNRGARLLSGLTARLGRDNHTFPAGTELFVATTDGGYDAYCLPHMTPGFWGNVLGERPWIPCYIDMDFDGTLDSQRNGGDRIAGAYAAVGGFEPHGEVVAPARFEESFLLDRYRQRIGVEVLENNLSDGVQEIVLALWIAAADNAPRVTLTGGDRVRIRSGETAIGEINGARIEFRYTGDRTIAYKILEGLPERPFSLSAR